MRTDRGHGSPYERGECDSYYNRDMKPHYFEGATYTSPLVEEKDMTPEEIAEYERGYEDNEESGDKKEW